jgi:hypothetical protein
LFLISIITLFSFFTVVKFLIFVWGVFMLTFSVLESEYQEAVENRRAAYRAKRERVIAKALELNDGKEPVEDAQGMLHAPCDGYGFVMAGNGYCEGDVKIYAGGEYLPFDNAERAGRHQPSFRRKFLFPKLLWDDEDFRRWRLKNGFDIEHSSDNGGPYRHWIGKVWHNENTGFDNLYVWLVAPNWELDHLEAILNAHYEKDVEAKPVVEKPTKGEAPVGHAGVSGKVLVTKVQDSMYGPSLKMLVELDNLATVWGSMPVSLQNAEDKLEDRNIRGHMVSFEADFEHAEGDASHSFFKRPKNAVLVSVSVPGVCVV